MAYAIFRGLRHMALPVKNHADILFVFMYLEVLCRFAPCLQDGQAARKCLQGGFARAPVGLDDVHARIKGFAVVEYGEVAEFVDDDVFYLFDGVLDEAGVEGQDAVMAASAPCFAHGAVTDGGHGAYPPAAWQLVLHQGGDVRGA